MNAVLKVARGRETLKAAKETPRDDVRDLDQEDGPGEARSLALTSTDITDEIFDPEEDLSIRVGRKTLEWVLGSEISVGDCSISNAKRRPGRRRDPDRRQSGGPESE